MFVVLSKLEIETPITSPLNHYCTAIIFYSTASSKEYRHWYTKSNKYNYRLINSFSNVVLLRPYNILPFNGTSQHGGWQSVPNVDNMIDACQLRK